MALKIDIETCQIPVSIGNGTNEEIDVIKETIKGKLNNGFEFLGMVTSGQILLLMFKKTT